jgi:hypothetical protein
LRHHPGALIVRVRQTLEQPSGHHPGDQLDEDQVLRLAELAKIPTASRIRLSMINRVTSIVTRNGVNWR